MPTNLPPQYFEVEKRYRAANTPQEKAATLEELLSTVPKHKGTEKLRGDLRKRLSKLKAEVQSRKKVSRKESLFHVEREGAGQVVVIGPTNVGKSALVAALTNAAPEVSANPFTTWSPTPGMMEVNNIQVQLIDTPPLDREYLEPELLALIRMANLVLLVVDLQTFPIKQLKETLAVLESHKIAPRRTSSLYSEENRMTFLPIFVLANKNDDESADEVFEIFCELLDDEWPCLPVSAITGRHLEELKQIIFEALDVIRVFAKPPGKEPDLDTPFVLPAGSTVADFAAKVHQDFYNKLKSARLWGSGVFDGQPVSRDQILQDGDIVELRL